MSTLTILILNLHALGEKVIPAPSASQHNHIQSLNGIPSSYMANSQPARMEPVPIGSCQEPTHAGILARTFFEILTAEIQICLLAKDFFFFTQSIDHGERLSHG